MIKPNFIFFWLNQTIKLTALQDIEEINLYTKFDQIIWGSIFLRKLHFVEYFLVRDC